MSTTEGKGKEAQKAEVQPEGREVWEAKPLSLANTARLIRLLAGQLIQKIILEAPQLQGASDSDILWAVMGALDEQSLTEFLSIAVDQPPDVIKGNYQAAKALGAAVDFMRLNDFGTLWGEARRLGGAGQPRKKKRKRRSASKK